MGRKFLQQLGRDGLPVEALLQHVEALHAALAQDQQFAVDRAREGDRLGEIGEGAGNVLAGARIDPRHLLPGLVAPPGGLDADAVPFPLAREGGRIEFREVRLLVDRVGEHRRAERRGVEGGGALPPPLDPGEQAEIRRLQPVPDLLHRIGLVAAERPHRRLGEAGGDAHAKRPGYELQQRPAPGLVEGIEPAGDMGRQVGFLHGGEGLDHFREGRDVRRRVVVARTGRCCIPSPLCGGGCLRSRRERGRPFRRWRSPLPTLADARATLPRRGGRVLRRPDQRGGLGEIAHVIVREREQHRVDPRFHQPADHRRLGLAEAEVAGHGGQRPAPLRVGRMGEIILQQTQLGVAARLIGEAVEEMGEVVHAAASSAGAAVSPSPSSP